MDQCHTTFLVLNQSMQVVIMRYLKMLLHSFHFIQDSLLASKYGQPDAKVQRGIADSKLQKARAIRRIKK
jgi:meiotically up-regulated gene 157 (Mug157) protein